MSFTTLVAFFFKTERSIVSVDLFGSWDSFKKPYSMERDTKLGRGHWRGCHSITDIVCDGESPETPASKRDKHLLEGGTYWYYYRLNDENEVHDTKRPSTTACPYLPGQQVNLLEVPMQLTDDGYPPSRDPLSVATLTPADRFAALKRNIVGSRRNSKVDDYATGGSRRSPTRDSTSRPRTALIRSGKVLGSVLNDLLGLADHVRAKSASLAADPSWSLEETFRPYSTGAMPDHWDSGEFSKVLTEIAEMEENGQEEKHKRRLSHARRLSVALERFELNGEAQSDESQDSKAAFSLGLTCEDVPFALRPASRRAPYRAPEHYPLETTALAENPGIECEAKHPSAKDLHHTFSVSSTRTSGFLSMTSDSELEEGESYVQRESQPRTPIRSEFGDVLVTTTWATPEHHRAFGPREQLNGGHMNVYSLSEAETASALTLQNLETATVKSANGESPVVESCGPMRMVEAWNDGNEHRRTALQELVDEMGYLGSLIG